MKKLFTFLLFLMVGWALTAQTSLPLTFEDGSLPLLVFDNGATATNVDNPDMNGNTSEKVVEFNKVQGSAWYSGVIFDKSLRMTPLIDIANDGTVFTVKIWSPKANVPVRFQLEQGFPDVEVSPSYEVFQTITTANVWTTLTFDFSDQVNDAQKYEAFSLFPDFDMGNQVPVSETAIYYIDDVMAVGAAAPTCTDGIQNGDETGVDCGGATCEACPESCTDGIMNQDETGVDCGGATCPECPADDPMTDAPDPTTPEADVLSVYSDTYTTNVVSDFNFTAFNGAVTTSEVDIEGNGNMAGKLENLDFYGSQWTDVDASPYTYVHLNYYATSAADFDFFIIKNGFPECCGSPLEPRYRFAADGDAPLVQGEWVSVFIPLQHFIDYDSGPTVWDLQGSFQTKFTSTGGTVYFDNIFFSTTNITSTDNIDIKGLTYFPNPVTDILSIDSEEDIISARIFDIRGAEVLQISGQSDIQNIDLSSLIDGMYFVKVRSAQNEGVFKIIKKQ